MNEKDIGIEFSLDGNKIQLSNITLIETLKKYDGSDIYEKAIKFLVDNLKIECVFKS